MNSRDLESIETSLIAVKNFKTLLGRHTAFSQDQNANLSGKNRKRRPADVSSNQHPAVPDMIAALAKAKR